MKTIKLRTNIIDTELERKMADILNNQSDICKWNLTGTESNNILIIQVKELLNEHIVLSGLNESGVETEILQIEKITDEGPIASSCD